MVLGPAGSYHLRDGTVVGESPLTPYGPLAPRHLARLDGIEHVGDLALISRVDEGAEMVAAFEELIGSHGGLGGWQTRASLLYPADWAPLPDDPLLGAAGRAPPTREGPGWRRPQPGTTGGPYPRRRSATDARSVLALQLRTGPDRRRPCARVSPASVVPRSRRPSSCQPRRATGGCSTIPEGPWDLFDGLLGLLSHDVGIDLGTANTLVTVRHRGIVISEPSVVAMDTRSKRVLAIGAEAKRMVGRTPANIVAIRRCATA